MIFISRDVSEDVKVHTIAFRVTDAEFEKIKEVATVLFNSQKLKADSVGALARAATFIQVNQFIQLQYMQQAADEREKVINVRKN
jgi:ASC-1-like (ASCH) protein